MKWVEAYDEWGLRSKNESCSRAQGQHESIGFCNREQHLRYILLDYHFYSLGVGLVIDVWYKEVNIPEKQRRIVIANATFRLTQVL